MRGRAIPLSVPRRVVIDYLRQVEAVPSAPVQRRMELGTVIAARGACAERPPWTAIFTKALALVADEMPELRRAYVKFPWPRIYEYPKSVAGIAIERDVDGEMAVLTYLIKDPAAVPVVDLGARIREAASADVRSIKDFRRVLDIARMPWPVRRLVWWTGVNVGRQRGNYLGTFGVSVFGGEGAEAPYPMSAWGILLNYGLFDSAGGLDVRLTFDHRIMDGSVVARALAKLEAALTGPLVEEMRTLPQRAGEAA